MNENFTTDPSTIPSGDLRTGLSILVGVLCVVTALLNIAVCVIISYHHRLHSLFFYYVFSVCVNECLRVATVMSLSSVRLITGSWQVSEAICHGWYFLHIFFTTNTLCHMGFMAADLFFIIRDPIKSKLSNTLLSNIFHVIRTWFTAAGTTGVPYLIFYLVPNGTQIYFLGCGTEKIEYILCSAGLCILLPIIVLIIINSASSKAIHDKNSLISKLYQTERTTERKTTPKKKKTNEPVQARYTRKNSFLFIDHDQNRGLSNSSQNIKIQITDPEDQTTDYISSPARGLDNPSFIPENQETSNSTEHHNNKLIHSKTSGNNIEMADMNGHPSTSKETEHRAEVSKDEQTIINNNKDSAKSPSKNIMEGQNSSMISSSDMFIFDNDGKSMNNIMKDSTQQESPQKYLNHVYELQLLGITSRMLFVHTKLLLLLLLFMTFLTLNLPYYILNVVYAVCASCRTDISQTLIWIFQWLTFATSLIHPIIYLAILVKITKR